MTEPSDVGLVARFRDSGDRRAFEALVLRHLGTLRRFLAVSLPRDPEGVADAEQEVLFRLYTALKRWRGEGSVTTLLFVLARRVVADEVRRRIRDRRNAQRFGLWTRAGHEFQEQEADPQRAWDRQDQGRALRQALEALPEPDRSLLYLKDAEGFDLEALCRIYGLKEGTVKSKLSRARARLRETLREEHHA